MTLLVRLLLQHKSLVLPLPFYPEIIQALPSHPEPTAQIPLYPSVPANSAQAFNDLAGNTYYSTGLWY